MAENDDNLELCMHEFTLNCFDITNGGENHNTISKGGGELIFLRQM